MLMGASSKANLMPTASSSNMDASSYPSCSTSELKPRLWAEKAAEDDTSH